MNDPRNDLVLASELARHGLRYSNESPNYRRARIDLLREEIELRRHIEAVGAQRRALPPGGELPTTTSSTARTGR